jgi:hypothetical protein
MSIMKSHMEISERHSKAALLASTTAVLILVLAGVLFAAELDAPGNLAPMAAGRDLCSGVTRAPGQSCPIVAKIRATSSGTKTAALAIPSNGGDEYVVSKSVPLTAVWHELFAN